MIGNEARSYVSRCLGHFAFLFVHCALILEVDPVCSFCRRLQKDVSAVPLLTSGKGVEVTEERNSLWGTDTFTSESC